MRLEEMVVNNLYSCNVYEDKWLFIFGYIDENMIFSKKSLCLDSTEYVYGDGLNLSKFSSADDIKDLSPASEEDIKLFEEKTGYLIGIPPEPLIFN